MLLVPISIPFGYSVKVAVSEYELLVT
jgi:hypothetical protein